MPSGSPETEAQQNRTRGRVSDNPASLWLTNEPSEEAEACRARVPHARTAWSRMEPECILLSQPQTQPQPVDPQPLSAPHWPHIA